MHVHVHVHVHLYVYVYGHRHMYMYMSIHMMGYMNIRRISNKVVRIKKEYKKADTLCMCIRTQQAHENCTHIHM